MREVKLKKSGKTVKLYESLKEIDAERMNEVQKYALVDLKIGSTMEDVDRHFTMFDKYLNAGDLEALKQERHNLHMGIYFQMQKINTKSLSFACLTHSIDDQVVDDFSQNNLINLSKQLAKQGLKDSEVQDIVEDIKKNLIPSLKLISLTDMEERTPTTTTRQ